MQIYNTLTRKKAEFVPIEPGKVGMYVCGPTVYDHPHIGHIRSAFIFDFIRKFFKYSGYKVTFVRNVTDVDDKIINRAARELKSEGKDPSGDGLKDKVSEISGIYLKAYNEAMAVFNIEEPDHEPRATNNIDEMVEFIEVLIEKGNAYEADGDVYFRVKSFPEYGKLSGQDIEQMKNNVRVSLDEKKQDPLDFALWKKVKESEPFWESPWGKGRPGWHIECSVMSTDILGDRFDIHGGGLDLIFPHHENEVAQARCKTDSGFAGIWIHNGFLTVEGEKMSKSLKNYITVNDYMDKYGDADLLKIMFLSSHYRSPVDFTHDKVVEASKNKEKIMIFLRNLERNVKAGNACGDQDKVRGLQEKFRASMDDDFNTPVALTVLYDAVHQGNKFLENGDDEGAMAARDLVLEICGVLGIGLSVKKIDDSESVLIEALVKKREEARSGKQFNVADNIRKELTDMGVTLEDTPEGTLWRKN